MRFSYAKLTAMHAEQWHTLMLEGTSDFPLGFLGSAADTAATTIERRRQILDFGTSRGVFEGETLVGFCGFRPEWFARTRHRAELGPFFVRAAYQGSGAALFLMQGIIEESRAGGVEHLELFVDTENHRAIAFYEKQGFERIATLPDRVRIDGKPRNDHFYRLRLSP